MKKCPNCAYLWDDDYNGSCLECGAPMNRANSSHTDLQFRYAAQHSASQKETSLEQSFKSTRGPARPGDAYDRAPIPDAILERARSMIVQREDVKYEDE